MPRLYFKICGLFFMLLVFGGCSSWSKHNVFFEPPRRLKIIILPVECTVRINKVKTIKSVKGSPPAAEIQEKEIKAEISGVTEQITRNLETGLNNSYFFEAVPLERIRLVMDVLGIKGPELSTGQLKDLAGALNAGLVFKTRLSGYGAIKKKWQMLLLGTGLVEGAVQGVVAYKLLHNKSLAVFIAAEEFAQEALVWGGGIYIFNHIFAPVILESELVSVEDGAVIWSKTAFSTIDKKAIKKYPAAERDLKELRLKVTAERAAGEIIKSLQETALKNLK